MDSLGIVLFPPRCGSCDGTLAARPRFGLCPPCLEVLEPNIDHRCPVCDLPGEAAVCRRCLRDPPPFERLVAPWIYGGPLTELVGAAKFRGREDIARNLGHLVIEGEPDPQLPAEASALVPVPLGHARRRRRGYNQAAVIARELGRHWDLPVVHGLRRVRDTPPQSDLRLAQRGTNVRDAFAVTGPTPSSVLLVDDVVTSTATVRAAAEALVRSGCRQVRVIALARATE